MGLEDKIGAAGDRAAGAAKATLGKATGNPELQAQGQAQNAMGQAQHTQDNAEEVEGTARDIADRPE